MSQGLDAFDNVQHYWCPMLGQTMLFSYCRKMQNGLPCHRVLVCFQDHFDVQAYLDANYDAERQEQFLSGGKSRVQRIGETLDGLASRKED